MMTKEELQAKIAELTDDLKNMASNDSNYGRVWDKRVELKAQLLALEQTE